MINDESPVDAAATNAAAAGDDTPRGDTAAESGAVPAAASTRRRRTSTTAPRASRARKAPGSASEGDAAVPPMAPEQTEPPLLSAAQPEDPGVTGSAQTPDAEVPPPPAEKPRRSTRRTPRKTEPELTGSVEPGDGILSTASSQEEGAVTVSPQPETAPGITPELAFPVDTSPEPAPEPARPARRQPARRKQDAAAEAVVVPEPSSLLAWHVEVEAPVVESPAADQPADVAATEPSGQTDAPEKRGRRRSSRGRRGAAAEAQGVEETLAAESPIETMAPVVSETAQEQAAAGSQPDAAAEAVVEPAEKSGRRRTTTRKRAAEQPQEPERGARLVSRKGVVDLLINGKAYPPIFFFGNMEGPKEHRRVISEVQRAAQSGVHIHSTLVELICPLPPDDTVYESLDSRLQALLDADPAGYLIPRIVFVPAPGWRKQYPNEVNHYADGSTDDPSIASDLFWREAESALKAVVEHVRRMTYGERVIGYHLERGEWFHPVDGGYDRSYANREAFRTWLRHKYKNEAALRGAWYDGQVQFYTAEIPAAPGPSRSEMAFFESRKDRRTVDFLEYTSEITADRLVSLGRAIKEASSNQALVSVCYGYTFEFGHTFSGHLSLGKVLESPAIDILAGPPSYRDRNAGGAGSLPAPVHSCAVHGKLWVTEDDTKTYLAPAEESPDDFNPRVENRFLTEQVHERAVGKSLAYQTGVSWMDTWGDGWLDGQEVWNTIGSGLERMAAFAAVRKQASPEVVMIIGEKGLLHLQRGDAFIRRILQEHRDIAQRCGASVGFYLQSDITARNFPTDARLYVFLTPYRLTEDQRVAIKEKLQGGGKTLVWLYAPGTCDARGEPVESAHDLVGMTLRQQSWNSEIGSRVADSRHVIVQQMQQRTVGVRERLNPSFYVDDDSPRLQTIAEYQQSGLPSIAVREMDSWKSVFCGEPVLSLDLLRGLCRFAGAHLYCSQGDDYLFSGDGWITLHAVRDGQKVVHLPSPMAVFDMTENRFLGEDLREVRLFMKAKSTHRLFVGAPDTLRKLGFPGVEKTPRGRRGRMPDEKPQKDELAAEPSETLVDVLPVSETDLAVEPTEITGRDLEGEEGLEAAQDDISGSNGSEQERQRRRRRRGGRGRGRRGRGGLPAEPSTGSAGGETPST